MREPSPRCMGGMLWDVPGGLAGESWLPGLLAKHLGIGGGPGLPQATPGHPPFSFHLPPFFPSFFSEAETTPSPPSQSRRQREEIPWVRVDLSAIPIQGALLTRHLLATKTVLNLWRRTTCLHHVTCMCHMCAHEACMCVPLSRHASSALSLARGRSWKVVLDLSLPRTHFHPASGFPL